MDILIAELTRVDKDAGAAGTRERLRAYYAAVPPGRRVRLLRLEALVRRVFPDAALTFRYKMPTFERAGRWMSIANQKQYISVRTCGEEAIARFIAKHPGIRHGRGCLNLRDEDVIPWKDMGVVVRAALGDARSASAKPAGEKRSGRP
jgi:uncharacterized protein YdhG (YjbR/CyaY superfamily)